MEMDAWVGLARDGSKALKVNFTTNDANRIKMWLSRLVGGGEKLDGAKDGTASKKIAPASKQCTEDMAAQGASSPGAAALLAISFVRRSIPDGSNYVIEYRGLVYVLCARYVFSCGVVARAPRLLRARGVVQASTRPPDPLGSLAVWGSRVCEGRGMPAFSWAGSEDHITPFAILCYR